MKLSAAAVLLLSAGFALAEGSAPSPVPAFGRDTVLVWKISTGEATTNFVVRIADFMPDRFLEWENESTQGTIFMPESAVKNAKNFVSARLFEGGVDTRGKDSTTLWLSERIYRDLKAKGRIKISLEGIQSWVTLDGSEEFSVEVNRATRKIPVIRVSDDRGSQRWFIDMPDNPLMVRHALRAFDQSLASVTTDRPNTLRWIKGKKLKAHR